MLIQKDQKKIKSVVENIYKSILPKKDVNYFKDEVIQIIQLPFPLCVSQILVHSS